MPSTSKNAELVTVRPKVTVSDGLRRLEWLSIFKAAQLQTTVTNRHSRLEPSLEPSLIAPKAENSPFAPPEVTSAARARGVAVTSYGWPVCYWAGDYADELKAARSRKETRP
jgi:hypothetical protein